MDLMKKAAPQKVVVDLICFLLIIFLWLLIKVVCEPMQNGFWCDDQSIRYPYYSDKSTTSLFLVIWCFLLPAITIIVFETIRVRKTVMTTTFINQSSQQTQQQQHEVVILIPWKYLAWKVYKKLAVFYLGAACMLLVTTVIKYTTGSLRPHFFDICKPSVDCLDDANRHQYIENYTCDNHSLDGEIRDARLSFISGHATYSSYCAIYFCIYLHTKMTSYSLVSLRTILQMMAILASVFAGLSRVAIHKHHSVDVMAGFALGSISGLLFAKYLSLNESQTNQLRLSYANRFHTVHSVSNTKLSDGDIKLTNKCENVSQC